MERSLTISRLAARMGSDTDLFARAAASDPVAFAEVYRRYHHRIYGFCLARVMNTQTAEDATQEVFIRLLQADATVVENPRAWLYGVARNVSTDALRRRMRLGEADPADEDSPAWDRLAAADSAEEVMGRETARNIFLALRKLSARYRTALILRELHGQTSAEIAEALETTVGAVDTLVSRARDAFGKTYAGVADLPVACASTVELIYRRLGTGVDSSEQDRIDSHVETCVRCREELKRAGNSRKLPALLPLLVPSRSIGAIPQALMNHPVAAHALAETCTNLTWLRCLLAGTAVAVATTVAVTGNIATPPPASPPHAQTAVAASASARADEWKSSTRVVVPAVETTARVVEPLAAGTVVTPEKPVGPGFPHGGDAPVLSRPDGPEGGHGEILGPPEGENPPVTPPVTPPASVDIPGPPAFVHPGPFGPPMALPPPVLGSSE